MTDKRKHIIVAFGEVLWDLLPDQSIIGGAPFNFTYRVNSLGNNGLMISRVGDDQLGKLALKRIWNLGLTFEYIQNDPVHPTGTVDIFFDDRMNPDFTINQEVAYDYIEFTGALAGLCKTADCFCYGTLAQRNDNSRETLHKLLDVLNDTLCFYDVNLRKDCYTTGIINDSLSRADIVKMNDTEALELNEILSLTTSGLVDIGKAITDKYSLNLCLITLGAQGVIAVSESGEICYVPGYGVVLADPLGAGDAFSAGFIHTWLVKQDLYEACKLGSILGAVTAGQQGATAPIRQSATDTLLQPGQERNIDKSLEKYMN